MTHPTHGFSERDEIELMLPWYATGKLGQTDRDRVTAYVAAHPEFKPELDAQMALIHEESFEVVRANEAIAAPSARGLERLMADVARQSKPGYGARAWAAIGEFLAAPSAPAVQWAGAAAAVLILAQAVIIGSMLSNDPPAGYETASGSAPATTQGTFVLVKFADGATAAEISAALGERGAAIVDGPKPGGVFRVRIGSATLDQAARDALIGSLRDQRTLFSLVMPEG